MPIELATMVRRQDAASTELHEKQPAFPRPDMAEGLSFPRSCEKAWASKLVMGFGTLGQFREIVFPQTDTLELSGSVGT